MTLLQASCVAIAGRGLVILGPPGSGKSSLALALIDRGALLVGDDGLRVERCGEQLRAFPPPRIAGLLEVRNVGLVSCAVASDVPLSLALRLDPAATRMPEQPDALTISGIDLPVLAFWPDSPVLALRAEAALARWGLPFGGECPHIGEQ